MQRMGMVIGIRPEHIAEYKRLHAAVWPEILACLAAAKVRNYSIFLREPENLLFGYWEYHGDDFAADMRRIAEREATRRWWALCGPCQAPLESRAEGEHWAPMERVFHMD
ncbi:L-rhamnose mutarotase [Chitinimonas koreensis]|uniref:L-rhamnose mutarotase n=1 Tax=Chitinimonas koreensis TaxID=356302 RepID=UPI00040B1174|nr:L-rhamnose mutarotase [Chitinimonas koreensis]QNM98799.1 L-rhamnose mutarotase [Chitinimonas koreensis]